MYTNILTKTSYAETHLSLCSLYSIISASFPSVKVTQVQRIFFNDARGRDYVADLRLPECAPVEVQVDQKYYCLSAAAAVIKYMEFVCNAGDVYYLRSNFIAFLFVCPSFGNNHHHFHHQLFGPREALWVACDCI